MTQFELVFMQWLRPVFSALEPVARILTEFGGEAFIFILIAVLYFAIDKEKGELLGVTVLASACVNDVLKTCVRRSRPFTYDSGLTPEDLRTHYEGSYSFPSGHAQNSAALYTSLMMMCRNRWIRAVCVVAMVVVPLTRVILGVHFPTDILVGSATGVCFAVLFTIFLRRIWTCRDRWYLGFGIASILIVFVVYLPLSVSFPDVTFKGKAFGVFAGLMLGLLIEHRYGRMTDTTDWRRRILRLLMAAACMAALYFSLDALLGLAGEHFTLDFAKYFLTIGVTMGVIPFCVRKLGI